SRRGRSTAGTSHCCASTSIRSSSSTSSSLPWSAASEPSTRARRASGWRGRNASASSESSATASVPVPRVAEIGGRLARAWSRRREAGRLAGPKLPTMAPPTSQTHRIVHPILLAGDWRASSGGEAFSATNPRTRRALEERYPVSGWDDLDAALAAAHAAAAPMRAVPGERIAAFLDGYAAGIEARAEAIVAVASQETALAASPRL